MVKSKGKPKLESNDADLRIETELEADPILRSSEGKATPLRIVMFGIAVVVIIGVFLWAAT